MLFYGRTIAHIYYDNDKSLAEELLKKGLAWHYKYYSKSELLAALEITAQENKVGLWKDENAMAPWEFRRK